MGKAAAAVGVSDRHLQRHTALRVIASVTGVIVLLRACQRQLRVLRANLRRFTSETWAGVPWSMITAAHVSGDLQARSHEADSDSYQFSR